MRSRSSLVVAAVCGLGGAACGGGVDSGDPAPTTPDAAEFASASRAMALLAHVDLAAMTEGAAAGVHAHHDEVGHTRGVSGAGNWGYTTAGGRRFALTGTSKGLSIVEVTSPTAPRVIALVPGEHNAWREVKTYRHWAYVTTEAETGMDVVSLADPDRPVRVRTWNETFTSAHTLWIDHERGLLFANGTSNGLRVLDLEPDPENPRDVGGFDGFYVHDSYARGDVLFASAIFDGFCALLDVSDPGRIFEITRFFTGGRFTHNSWLTRDGRYLFTTDESPGRPLEGWDVSDPMQPRKVSEYNARPDGLPHNVMVDGDRLLVAHYHDGVRLLDIRDPEHPREIGFYDTYDGPEDGFDGAWGAYVFPGSDLVLASDISGGLFVLQHVGG